MNAFLEGRYEALLLELAEQPFYEVHFPQADLAEAACKPSACCDGVEEEIEPEVEDDSADANGGDRCTVLTTVVPEARGAQKVCEKYSDGSPMSAKTTVRIRGSGLHVEEERDRSRCFYTFVHSSAFELFFSGLIVLNAFNLAVEAQYDGIDVGYRTGYPGITRSASDAWPGAQSVLAVSEIVFGITFSVEVVAKLLAERSQFFRSGWNQFDSCIIVFWAVGMLDAVNLDVNPTLLRLARLFRLCRLLRLFKTFAAFDVLHILIGSLRASLYVLLWSIVLLALLMLAGALILHLVVSPVILDMSNSEVKRHTLYEYFGTFTRGMLTMFELTLGNWVPVTRILHEDVNEWFGLVMLTYRSLVGFAAIKVISGVFLHETFKVASSDDELMIMQRNRQLRKHVQKMQQLFNEADDSGDGYLSEEEFYHVMNDSRVQAWLAAMELEVSDAELVFSLVDDGDHKISAEELVHGFARLKGTARSIDMATMLQQNRRIEGMLLQIVERQGRESLRL